MAQLTADQKARVIELKAKGVSYRLICAAVGCRLAQAKQVIKDQADQAERERLARDKAEARRMFEAGLPRSFIAKQLRRGTRTVRGWTRDLQEQRDADMLAEVEAMTWVP